MLVRAQLLVFDGGLEPFAYLLTRQPDPWLTI
jgi:hypothetical protein